MTKKIFWCLSALPVTLASVCASAQSTNGTILGTVVDTTKAAVGNASIVAINSGTQARSLATARGDGSFSVQVPPGNTT